MPKDTFLNLPTEKRDRIVDLALEEFATKPYAEASLSNVVARAGIAKGSMYQYFENKLDLYRYLLLDVLPSRKMAHVAAHAPRPEGGLFEFIRAAAESGVRFAAENPRLMRFGAVTLEPASDPEVAALHRALNAQIHAYWVDALTGAKARGEVRADLDPAVAASLVIAVAGQGIVAALLARLGTDLRSFLLDEGAAARVTDEDVRAIVRETLALLRDGLAPRGEVAE